MRKCHVTIKATDNPNLTIKKNIRENQHKSISSLKNIKSGIGVCKKKEEVKSRENKRV